MTNDTPKAREFWIREDGGIVKSEDQGIHVIEYSAYELLWEDRDSIYDGYHELRKERNAALDDCFELGKELASLEMERDEYREVLERLAGGRGTAAVVAEEVLAKYPDSPQSGSNKENK